MGDRGKTVRLTEGAAAGAEARASDASEVTVGEGGRTWVAYLSERAVSPALAPATAVRRAGGTCKSLDGASSDSDGSSEPAVAGFASLAFVDSWGRFEGTASEGPAVLCSGVRFSAAPSRLSPARAGEEGPRAGEIGEWDAGAIGALVTIVRSSSANVAGVSVTIVRSSSSRSVAHV